MFGVDWNKIRCVFNVEKLPAGLECCGEEGAKVSGQLIRETLYFKKRGTL